MQVSYVESTVVAQVQDHGEPVLRDRAYLRVIVHSGSRRSSMHSERGQLALVGGRRSAAPSAPRSLTVVAGAVLCCGVVLTALILLLVVVVRRRTKGHS